MTQPLDRTAKLPALGAVDEAAGEFWVENPFMMPEIGENLSAYERNKLFLNTQDQRFLDVSFASAVDLDSDSRSAIPADFNRDGRIDLLVCSVGGGPVRLFQNQFPASGNRVRVRLIGTDSNRSAIGTRVTLHIGELRIVRDNFAANGFMGQGPAEVLVGVGDAKRIDRIEIRWPTGEKQMLDAQDVNTVLTITEGQADVDASPLTGLAK